MILDILIDNGDLKPELKLLLDEIECQYEILNDDTELEKIEKVVTNLRRHHVRVKKELEQLYTKMETKEDHNKIFRLFSLADNVCFKCLKLLDDKCDKCVVCSDHEDESS